LNYLSLAVSNFQALAAGPVLPLDCFLRLKLCNAKSELKNEDFIFNSCDDRKFVIYRFTTVYFAELKKLFTWLIEQRFARMFEVNLECSLLASRLVGEPIKCACSPPFRICD